MSRGVVSNHGPEAGLVPSEALKKAQEKLRISQPFGKATIVTCDKVAKALS